MTRRFPRCEEPLILGNILYRSLTNRDFRSGEYSDKAGGRSLGHERAQSLIAKSPREIKAVQESVSHSEPVRRQIRVPGRAVLSK